MPIDQTALGTAVAEQMAAIEQDHQGDDCELGDVLVIAEVLCPATEQREVRIRSYPASPHTRVGLLTEALRNELMMPLISQDE